MAPGDLSCATREQVRQELKVLSGVLMPLRVADHRSRVAERVDALSVGGRDHMVSNRLPIQWQTPVINTVRGIVATWNGILRGLRQEDRQLEANRLQAGTSPVNMATVGRGLAAS